MGVGRGLASPRAAALPRRAANRRLSSPGDPAAAAPQGRPGPCRRPVEPVRPRRALEGARGALRPPRPPPAHADRPHRAPRLPRGRRCPPGRGVARGGRRPGGARHLLRARRVRRDADPVRGRSCAAPRAPEGARRVLGRDGAPRLAEPGRPRDRARSGPASARPRARGRRATPRGAPPPGRAARGRLGRARARRRTRRRPHHPAGARLGPAPRRHADAPRPPRRHALRAVARGGDPVPRGRRREALPDRPVPHAAPARRRARRARRDRGRPPHAVRRRRRTRGRRGPRGGARARRACGRGAPRRPRRRELRAAARRARDARRAGARRGGAATTPVRRVDGAERGMTAVLAAVEGVLEAGRHAGVAPALSAAVCRGGALVHASFHGELPAPGARALRRDDLFDLASLTKVMATATLAAQLVDALALDAPVAQRLPGFEAGGKEAVTLRHLLAHASGLPRWRPYFELAAADPVARAAFLPPEERPPFAALRDPFARGKALVRAAVLSEALEEPPGARALYCDPGFLALGFLVEDVAGAPLAQLADRRVFRPLALTSTFFLDGLTPEDALARGAGRGFAPTERCDHR